jgi:N-acetylmuramoyl-L-alanine amidase
MHSFASGCSMGPAGASAVAILLWFAAAAPLAQTNVESLYRDALRQEAEFREDLDNRKRAAPAAPLLERSRTLAQTYEDIVRLFPGSGHSDNALWQAAVLAGDTFWEFGEAADRVLALRLFRLLQARYPSSSLLKQVPAHVARLEAADATPPDLARTVPREAPGLASPPRASSTLRSIRRERLPDALRVTLEFDREVAFYDERIVGPPRVFIDLQNTRAVEALEDAALSFPDDLVRQIRVGRQEARTRVVLDIQGAARHSVYPLYNPYRIVVDFERIAPDGSTVASTRGNGNQAPAVPSPNVAGSLSLSRQLGLGVGRVIIDPGHGGHDPGAEVRGISEAELTLDVALRLEKLLLKEPGVEVVLTRRTNVYVPLEERTAIANRAAADLFLSIHANASADTRARGIETYFLNFASNSAAEALAARENAGSSRTMRELSDIVKTIALNDKIDESRDFASFVQGSMYDKLRRVNRQARNLGVKQAPFVVLIGATMPSILVEISFLTNRQEASLLRTARYREHIADALLAGVMKYQRSLKRSGSVAAR